MDQFAKFKHANISNFTVFAPGLISYSTVCNLCPHSLKMFVSVWISAREGELRQLRKQNTEYEEQNAILSKHIENMKQAIEKLEVEAVRQRSNNMALQQHLDGLRTMLTTNFSSVPLPGTSCNVGRLGVIWTPKPSKITP